jgi:8-oxo-dGTP diphosphatase
MKHQTIQVAVDIVVFTVHEQSLRVLLIERGIDPFKGLFALPGGFVLAEETLEQAAFRELFEREPRTSTWSSSTRLGIPAATRAAEW